MSVLRLPGLVDVHVHMRQPGGVHKEDWDSGTAAALAGGFTTVLAMPNTSPPVTDAGTFESTIALANQGARCDWGQYVGATATNATSAASLAPVAAGLKMYLNDTYGELRVEDMSRWADHVENWPADRPLVVHAEGPAMAAAILLAALTERPVHIAHVSRRDEIELIRNAKESGLPVTCEASPHHLSLSEKDSSRIGEGRSQVRPPLAAPEDGAALWEHLEAIDCFATDHAPHTAAEKDSAAAPPGFPGLETALPLLLTAVHQGRLSTDDIVQRLATNPRRIFGLTESHDTYLEVDPDDQWTISASECYTRAGWTPFQGTTVRGRLRRVVIRGEEAFRDGEVLAGPGTGRNVRTELEDR